MIIDWLMIDDRKIVGLLINDWLIDDWWLFDDLLMIKDGSWLTDVWLMIGWWLIDNWLMINLWLKNDGLLIDWWFNVWWFIEDWLMINRMALSKFWLCLVLVKSMTQFDVSTWTVICYHLPYCYNLPNMLS